MLCPNCKTDKAGRSHRRGLIEYGVSVFGYYPYSCRDCHRRFLRLRKSIAQDPSPGHPGVEREIRATRDAMSAKRKRRELVLYVAAIIMFWAFLYFITRDRGSSIEGDCTAPAPPVNYSAPILS
jgi:hypothetical protein